MRSVHLAPREQTAEFRFPTPAPGLSVSLAAIGVGIALLGTLVIIDKKQTAVCA